MAKQTEEGIRLLDQSSQIFGGDSGLSITFLAMFSRLKGQLLLQMSPARLDEAERCFQQSLKIAIDLEASMLELRAATSLTRLWREQGKTVQGKQLLRSTYEKLTEGFTTADLAEAKALLEDLA